MGLIFRNSDSQTPDMWLKMSRNIQCIPECYYLMLQGKQAKWDAVMLFFTSVFSRNYETPPNYSLGTWMVEFYSELTLILT